MAEDDGRQGFLDALAADEDDEATRLVYADWLEERGEYEESQRQRSWTAAKRWIASLVENSVDPFVGPLEIFEEPGSTVYYDILIARATAAVEADLRQQRSGRRRRRWISINIGSDMDLEVAIRKNAAEFWKNWSIVTGIPLPDDIVSRSTFSCSC